MPMGRVEAMCKPRTPSTAACARSSASDNALSRQAWRRRWNARSENTRRVNGFRTARARRSWRASPARRLPKDRHAGSSRCWPTASSSWRSWRPWKIHYTPQTRQLARHRRDRTQCLHQAVSRSAHRRHRHPALRGQGLGGSPQCFRGRCRLAVHDRQCTHQAQTPLSAT